MGIRVVITYHTYYIDVGFHKTVNALVDKELVCNSAAAVKAREATGNRSIGCIPLPCLQYDNVDIETARKKLNIPLDKKIVASHGFFQQHKGYDCLVKSLAYMGNNTEIWIIGAGDVKHECYQHIRYLIKNLKIKSKVKIFDQYLTMDKVMEKLQCANIIAYAYTIKGYYSASAAARTGLSCGRPCVVSHSPMFEDIFPITKQFPMLDSRALAEISNNLIGDKKESDKLVKKSMEYVRSYPPEKISQLHNELYLNLL